MDEWLTTFYSQQHFAIIIKGRFTVQQSCNTHTHKIDIIKLILRKEKNPRIYGGKTTPSGYSTSSVLLVENSSLTTFFKITTTKKKTGMANVVSCIPSFSNQSNNKLGQNVDTLKLLLCRKL